MVDWFLEYCNKCFRDFFFRARDVFFNLRVFCQICKVLVQSMWYFIVISLFRYSDYSMIMLAVLLLLENSVFTAFLNFLLSVILLKFKLLKYCCFAFLKSFCTFFPLLSIVLQMHASVKFILLRNFDLFMISFLSLFVIKVLLYLILFCS